MRLVYVAHKFKPPGNTMSESLNPSRRLRYVYLRQGNKIEEGVLAKSLIRRILEGNLTGADEISGDGIHWARLDEHPQLIPYLDSSSWESDYLEPLQAEPEEIPSADDDWFQRVFSSPLYDGGHDIPSPLQWNTGGPVKSDGLPLGGGFFFGFNGAGIPGVNGSNGANGVNGTNGVNGANGVNGVNGAKESPEASLLNGKRGLEMPPIKEIEPKPPAPPQVDETARQEGEAAETPSHLKGNIAPERFVTPQAGPAEVPQVTRWLFPGALFLALAGLLNNYFPAMGTWVELAGAVVLAGFALGWVYRWEKRQQVLLGGLKNQEADFPYSVASDFCERVSDEATRDALRAQLSLHYAGAARKKRKGR